MPDTRHPGRRSLGGWAGRFQFVLVITHHAQTITQEPPVVKLFFAKNGE